MKKILERLYAHETLTAAEAAMVMDNITNENYNLAQIASFLTVFQMRSITPQELEGFCNALMAKCKTITTTGLDTIDVCGTGGDGKDTFNISTVSAFVVAGAGYKVAKHGNKSVSSNCGSSDVLQALGYQLTNDEDILLRQLESANLCYMHAPLFHPSLKSVAQLRKDLNVKTVLNMLGPLVNPAQPNHQLVGVYALRLMRLYKEVLRQRDMRFTIVHGLDTYDEISLTSDTKLISGKQGDQIIRPEDFGFSKINPSSIHGGGTIDAAKKIFLDILSNKGTTEQTAVVVANSAMAIDCFKSESDITASVLEAKESLESGRAMESLKKLVA